MMPYTKLIYDKHCFVYCGPERCDCKNGNPELWKLQQEKEKPPREEVDCDARAKADWFSVGGSDF